MATQLFANNATGYLNTAITAGATSITLQSGQGSLFPSPSAGDWFLATIYDGASTIEIVKCTARSSDTFTVTRAQESTTASAFSAGASVEMALTKGTLELFPQLSGGALPVTSGGTGLATITNHGVMLGQGTGNIVTPSLGSAGQVLTSNGASSDPSFSSHFGTLIATLTPTAAANVDSLSSFSSSYDSYVIIGTGILPAATDTLLMRLATGGTADTGSNYAANTTLGTTFTVTGTSLQISDTNAVLGSASSGKGTSFRIWIHNVNDTTNIKEITTTQVGQTNATPGWRAYNSYNVYTSASAVSGVRFYWSGGSNFSATGKIRIYGIQNT